MRKREEAKDITNGEAVEECVRDEKRYIFGALCCLSEVQNLDVSGLNLGPCRLIQLCRSSGFVVLLHRKLGPLINGL